MNTVNQRCVDQVCLKGELLSLYPFRILLCHVGWLLNLEKNINATALDMSKHGKQFAGVQ